MVSQTNTEVNVYNLRFSQFFFNSNTVRVPGRVAMRQVKGQIRKKLKKIVKTNRFYQNNEKKKTRGSLRVSQEIPNRQQLPAVAVETTLSSRQADLVSNHFRLLTLSKFYAEETFISCFISDKKILSGCNFLLQKSALFFMLSDLFIFNFALIFKY